MKAQNELRRERERERPLLLLLLLGSLDSLLNRYRVLLRVRGLCYVSSKGMCVVTMTRSAGTVATVKQPHSNAASTAFSTESKATAEPIANLCLEKTSEKKKETKNETEKNTKGTFGGGRNTPTNTYTRLIAYSIISPTRR